MFRLGFNALTVYLTYLFLVQAARTPKIGFEIETADIRFYNKDCTEDANTAMKGHQVRGQKDEGWFLGVDTSAATKTILQPEYDVLCDIEEDTYQLESLMADVRWSMSRLDTGSEFWIQNSKGQEDIFNPWRRRYFPAVFSDKAKWDVQATAPLMLEAIQDLFVAAVQRKDHPLVIQDKDWSENLVYVQKNWFDSKYFQEVTEGSDWATKDVMGFLSIVLSNIKMAQELTASIFNPVKRKGRSTQGPKTLVWLMPRNYWTSVFSLVKKKLPEGVQLWEILEHLACYQNTKDEELKLDYNFCNGQKDDPRPNGKLQNKAWSLQGGGDPLPVKTWVESIVSRRFGSPDALSAWDAKHFDGQIGAFDRMQKSFEEVLESQRKVPLWEFRGLGMFLKADLSERVVKIQREIIKFHKKYPEEPIS
ncbi:hypothetical protein LZ30DRAFT_733573 [Colletotrichum cereale]|nr:hypothetical protein LZ30DRAFT_733573 [Colletotrichum cereale]